MTMDNETEFIVETVGRGVALNSKTFLLEDELHLIARCHTTVTLFVIDKANFTNAVGHDSALTKTIQEHLDKMILNEKNVELDITYVKPKIRAYNIQKNYVFFEKEKAQRAQLMSNLFKNTIINFLMKNRKKRKVPKVEEILKLSIE